jgi:hypothetical protein
MAGDRAIRTEIPKMKGRVDSAPRNGMLPNQRAGTIPVRSGGVPADGEAGFTRTAIQWVERTSHAVIYAAMSALLVALMIGFSVGPVARSLVGKKNKDYRLWYQTGRTMLEGGEIYPRNHQPFPFMYPPSCAAMLALASIGGEVPFVISLIFLNSAAWLAAILLAVYLATGRILRQDPLLYLIPTLCVSPFVHDTYLLGQPNLLLLALMLGAFACLRLQLQGGAGVLIALAAAIKAFPILAIGYLAYRRCWKAIAALVVGLVVLVLVLPMGFRNVERARDDLATWNRGMVLKYDTYGIAQRPMRSFSFKNQSLMATANRLLRSIPADGEVDRRWKVNIADLDFRMVNAVIVLAGLGLCTFFMVSMPRREQRTEQTDAIESAMLLQLILIFSPLSFNYFYVWLLYPLTVALHLVLSAPGRSSERVVLISWLAVIVFLLALAIPFLRGAQAYGNLFFANLLLLIGLGWGMRRMTGLAPTS